MRRCSRPRPVREVLRAFTEWASERTRAGGGVGVGARSLVRSYSLKSRGKVWAAVERRISANFIAIPTCNNSMRLSTVARLLATAQEAEVAK